jgi:hypothetical protein
MSCRTAGISMLAARARLSLTIRSRYGYAFPPGDERRDANGWMGVGVESFECAVLCSGVPERRFDVEPPFSPTTPTITNTPSTTRNNREEERLTQPHRKSILREVEPHVKEHYPSLPAFGVYPGSEDSTVTVVFVGNKYSPSNYWNGRWRSTYTFNPSTSELTGHIQVDVHYYEDGNVRLLTNKPVQVSLSSGSAAEIVKTIAGIEKKYQEDLNRAFGALSEGAFKSLRRQLPITRQKIDWDKIGSYRLGQGMSSYISSLCKRMVLMNWGRYWWRKGCAEVSGTWRLCIMWGSSFSNWKCVWSVV